MCLCVCVCWGNKCQTAALESLYFHMHLIYSGKLLIFPASLWGHFKADYFPLIIRTANKAQGWIRPGDNFVTEQHNAEGLFPVLKLTV